MKKVRIILIGMALLVMFALGILSVLYYGWEGMIAWVMVSGAVSFAIVAWLTVSIDRKSNNAK